MKKVIPLILVYCSFSAIANAQSLPANTCGVVYTYDAAGNRTQRTYLCNNSSRVAFAPLLTENTPAKVQQVAHLYPNPTTGRFTVTFSQSLMNATVTLLDMAGNVLHQSRKSGNEVQFDLSSYSAALYIVRVTNGENSISFKVVKQ